MLPLCNYIMIAEIGYHVPIVSCSKTMKLLRYYVLRLEGSSIPLKLLV